jgi:hypothetical protein
MYPSDLNDAQWEEAGALLQEELAKPHGTNLSSISCNAPPSTSAICRRAHLDGLIHHLAIFEIMQ